MDINFYRTRASIVAAMSDPSISHLDASTVANVVNGVINALGLQPTQPQSRGSDSNSTSLRINNTATVTQSRRITRLVCHI